MILSCAKMLKKAAQRFCCRFFITLWMPPVLVRGLLMHNVSVLRFSLFARGRGAYVMIVKKWLGALIGTWALIRANTVYRYNYIVVRLWVCLLKAHIPISCLEFHLNSSYYVEFKKGNLDLSHFC